MAALVEINGLAKHFPLSRTLGEIARREHPLVRAVDGVSFDIAE
ncbi:MAG: peptide ABC transporter substrate-binding protein, partial [Proteobacteria bacterium]|nr:peptide ABC transporter substrate-binding protein [Pseudomonadota bacterium]